MAKFVSAADAISSVGDVVLDDPARRIRDPGGTVKPDAIGRFIAEAATRKRAAALTNPVGSGTEFHNAKTQCGREKWEDMMKTQPRITLIHATRLAIEPIETAANELWPEAETISMLEEGLSIDRAISAELSAGLKRRISSLAEYAEGTGSDGILFTCSAFGEAIEDAARTAAIPVMKPNEAMFEAALGYGDRIAMIYTFPPSASGMEAEFRETAAENQSSAKLVSVFCADAMEAKKGGDDSRHDDLIATTAATISDVDVILLAQFSMSGAAAPARQRTSTPLLTAPESAIKEMRRRIGA